MLGSIKNHLNNKKLMYRPDFIGSCNQRTKNEVAGRRRKETASPRRSIQRRIGGYFTRASERAVSPR